MPLSLFTAMSPSRFSICALVFALGALAGGSVCADDSDAPWWPWGGNEQPQRDTPAEYEPGAAESGLPNEGWPAVRMPRFEWTPLWTPPGDAREGLLNIPINRAKSVTRYTARTTRNTWNRAVEGLKWGGGQPRTAASRQRNQPGLFGRFFGDDPEPEGPQTVVEWMAQDRPGMTKRQ